MATTPTSQPVAVDPAQYVLPAPPRQQGNNLLCESPANGHLAGHRAAASVQIVGERIVAMLECQERFLAEVRTVLVEMDESVADESRARIKAQLRTLGEILDWTEAVQADLIQESRWAATGCQPVDLVAVCAEAAARFREARPGFSVNVVGVARRPVWSMMYSLTSLLELALAVVSERVRGRTGLAIEIADGHDFASIRCAGSGEPVSVADPELVASFREAARRVGASIHPDELGAGSTGLVLRLPYSPS